MFWSSYKVTVITNSNNLHTEIMLIVDRLCLRDWTYFLAVTIRMEILRHQAIIGCN
jgi:hypothetical protein